MHPRIEPALQLLLQPHIHTLARLLRPRVLIRPRIVIVRDRDARLLALLRLADLGVRRLAHVLPEALDLVQDHLAHLGHVLDDLESEVEGGGAGRLVRGIVPDVQVFVLERLFDRDAARGVEGEHPVQQVESLRVGDAEERLEGDLLHVWQVSDVLLGAGRADAGESFFVGGAEVVEDLIELVDVVAAFEERFAAKKLRKDTAYRPNID